MNPFVLTLKFYVIISLHGLKLNLRFVVLRTLCVVLHNTHLFSISVLKIETLFPLSVV